MADEIRMHGGLRRSLSLVGRPLFDPDLPQLWGRRPTWEARSRWAIAPLIAVAVLVTRSLGFEFAVEPVLLIAALHPISNTALVWAYRRAERSDRTQTPLDRSLLFLEVLVDYLAVFALIHFTGGVRSPLAFFLIFHVILAAIQFSKGRAYIFASWAAAGLWLLLWLDAAQLFVSPTILFRGQAILPFDGVTPSAVRVFALSGTFFVAALLTGKIMENLRRRVTEVAETTVELSRTNQKLRSLYAIVGSLGAERSIQPILDLVAEQLVTLVEDTAVGIALLEDEGTTLRFAAAHGLPTDFVLAHRIDLRESPFHHRVLLGETMVEGQVQRDDTHPLRNSFSEIGIRSIAIARMAMDGRPIGTLGLYSRTENRFRDIDAEFLEMTAELVSIAIEDARTNEAIDRLAKERTQLMLQVAHNLRAPLGASLGLLDLVSEDEGVQSPDAQAHLTRIGQRLRSLDEMVGELLQIAKSRDWAQEIADVVVDPAELVREIESTFREETDRKGLRFVVFAGDDLPTIESGGDLIIRSLENLVSNAIKYTPEGGEVVFRAERLGAERVCFLVRDSGIGIPATDQKRLFSEFFRASNAKLSTSEGTGLGLAFVKHAVERHHGHIHLASKEGVGTVISIELFEKRPQERPVGPSVTIGSLG